MEAFNRLCDTTARLWYCRRLCMLPHFTAANAGTAGRNRHLSQSQSELIRVMEYDRRDFHNCRIRALLTQSPRQTC